MRDRKISRFIYSEHTERWDDDDEEEEEEEEISFDK